MKEKCVSSTAFVNNFFYCILFSHLIYSTSHFISLWPFPLLFFFPRRTNTHIFLEIDTIHTLLSRLCRQKWGKAFKNNLKGLFTLGTSFREVSVYIFLYIFFFSMECIIKSCLPTMDSLASIFLWIVFKRENCSVCVYRKASWDS